jgi:hypothetical protein
MRRVITFESRLAARLHEIEGKEPVAAFRLGDGTVIVLTASEHYEHAFTARELQAVARTDRYEDPRDLPCRA